MAVVDGLGFAKDPRPEFASRDPDHRSRLQTITFRYSRDPTVRKQSMVRVVLRAIRRHRPACVVIGTNPRESPFAEKMREVVVRSVGAEKIACTVLPVPEMYKTVTGNPCIDMRRLAPALQQLLPGLAPPRGRNKFARAYERPAWNALGLAVVGLTEHAPLAALALLPPNAAKTPLGTRIHALAQSHASYATHPATSIR